MALGPWQRAGFAALVIAITIAAQQPTAPAAAQKFDVVSIRAAPPIAAPILREQDFTPVLPGGQYVDSRTTLLSMIGFAYNMKNMNLSRQLVGLPDWAKHQVYSVAAKSAEGFPSLPPSENQAQVRLMMRAMLADRLHLQLHPETRLEPIYNLEVAKGGIKIQQVDPPAPPAREGPVGAAMGDRDGRMIGNKSTMAGLAAALNIFLDRPVVDRTGLKGYYDFDVHWRALDAPDEQAPRGRGFGNEGAALLLSNLQDQLGLRLSKTTGPVEYWVVDHVEPPTAN